MKTKILILFVCLFSSLSVMGQKPSGKTNGTISRNKTKTQTTTTTTHSSSANKPKTNTNSKPKTTTGSKPQSAKPHPPRATYANGVLTVNGSTYKMVYVEGGTFTMGGTSEQGSDADSDERPTHNVTLSNYMIGQTEVTQELWQAVMGSNPSNRKGSNLPVERVSWNDCQAFVRKLNGLTGQNFRLPTEAEWEYAARGGKKSIGYKYSGGDNLGNVAWYTDNSGSKTHPVATKQPNELGIYDMSGNVWEWCQDWYGSYSSSSLTNPTGAASGSLRVYRGGSWLNDAWSCRVSYRSNNTPSFTSIGLGLRLAL